MKGNFKPERVGQADIGSADLSPQVKGFVEDMKQVGLLAADVSAGDVINTVGTDDDIGAVFRYADGRLSWVPPEDDLYTLSIVRNRNLITVDQQQSIREANIAILGLSVGSCALDAMLRTGFRRFLVADKDTLDPSNLNRIADAHPPDIGFSKTDLAARRVYYANPYADVGVLADGFGQEELKVVTEFNPDIMVEEMDSVWHKVLARRFAQESGAAVITAADVGYRSIVDVERHDFSGDVAFFDGRISAEECAEMLGASTDNINPAKSLDYITQIVDSKHVVEQQDLAKSLEALQRRDIFGLPQLGEVAIIGGGLVAATARDIVIAGDTVPSGRRVFDTRQTA